MGTHFIIARLHLMLRNNAKLYMLIICHKYSIPKSWINSVKLDLRFAVIQILSFIKGMLSSVPTVRPIRGVCQIALNTVIFVLECQIRGITHIIFWDTYIIKLHFLIFCNLSVIYSPFKLSNNIYLILSKIVLNKNQI